MPLSAANQSKIQRSSRQHVEDTISALAPTLNSKRWLSPRNRYAGDVVERINDDVTTGSKHRPRQLAQYISASSALHAMDGWSYLGRSLSALLRGDPHRSIHLGYYAELRAVMSILAAEGVGIFDKRHFVIDGPDSVAPIHGKLGTHQFTWDVFELWASDSRSGNLFTSVIASRGTTLDQWFANSGGAATLFPLAKQWFLQWGMDISLPLKDRRARNESSYRPDGIGRTWTLNADETLQAAKEVWRSLEPTPRSPFEQIDWHILRIATEKLFYATTGSSHRSAKKAYGAYVEGLISARGFDAATAQLSRDFILRRHSAKDLEILALSRLQPSHPTKGHLAVLARAALLLRVASGSVRTLLGNANLKPEAIAFWLTGIGGCRGLWDVAKDGTDYMDLWADVQAALEDIAAFEDMIAVGERTFFKFGSQIASPILGLGACERIALWSLS